MFGVVPVQLIIHIYEIIIIDLAFIDMFVLVGDSTSQSGKGWVCCIVNSDTVCVYLTLNILVII